MYFTTEQLDTIYYWAFIWCLLCWIVQLQEIAHVCRYHKDEDGAGAIQRKIDVELRILAPWAKKILVSFAFILAVITAPINIPVRFLQTLFDPPFDYEDKR